MGGNVPFFRLSEDKNANIIAIFFVIDCSCSSLQSYWIGKLHYDVVSVQIQQQKKIVMLYGEKTYNVFSPHLKINIKQQCRHNINYQLCNSSFYELSLLCLCNTYEQISPSCKSHLINLLVIQLAFLCMVKHRADVCCIFKQRFAISHIVHVFVIYLFMFIPEIFEQHKLTFLSYFSVM